MKNGNMWHFIRYLIAHSMMEDGPKKDRYEADMDKIWDKLSAAEVDFVNLVSRKLVEGVE